VRSLAVIASGGAFSNLVHIATLTMVAVGSGIAVRIFFRDEAVLKVTKAGAARLNLSEVYREDEAGVRARLEAQGLRDLPALFREMKEVGELRLYVCSSLAICEGRPEDLIPEIDEVHGLTAFLLEDVAAADRVLTF
jgi:peroxiredoxin family protein